MTRVIHSMMNNIAIPQINKMPSYSDSQYCQSSGILQSSAQLSVPCQQHVMNGSERWLCQNLEQAWYYDPSLTHHLQYLNEQQASDLEHLACHTATITEWEKNTTGHVEVWTGNNGFVESYPRRDERKIDFLTIFNRDQMIIERVSNEGKKDFYANQVLRCQYLRASKLGQFVNQKPRELILKNVANSELVCAMIDHMERKESMPIEQFLKTKMGHFVRRILDDFSLHIVKITMEKDGRCQLNLILKLSLGGER